MRPKDAAPPAEAWRRWLSPREEGSGGWHRRRPPAELGRTSGLRHTANPEIPSPPAPAARRRCCCLAGDGEGNHQLWLLPPGDSGSSSGAAGNDAAAAKSAGLRLRRMIAESHEVERRGGSLSFLRASSLARARPLPPKIADRKDRPCAAVFLLAPPLSSAGSSPARWAAAAGPTWGVRKKRRLGCCWCANDDEEVAAYAQASERRCAAYGETERGKPPAPAWSCW